jgi:hypothetical protein
MRAQTSADDAANLEVNLRTLLDRFKSGTYYRRCALARPRADADSDFAHGSHARGAGWLVDDCAV